MADKQLSLFGGDEAQPKSQQKVMRFGPGSRFASRVREMANRGVYLGTSSWKYPGWLGQVYDPDRYEARKRFSQKKFDDTCLAEYATVFPTVGGDFSFYQFPSTAYWRKLFDLVPTGFKFGLKVPETVTAVSFSKQERYGSRAGTDNEHFMDAALLREQFLEPLEPYRDKVGVLMFEFGTIHSKPLMEPQEFVRRLDKMLTSLPMDRFSFAVEVRNPSFIEDGSAYLACLRQHGAAHCFNSWTHMLPVDRQMELIDTRTASVTAARFLLKPGRTYQQAVDAFSPYERVQDPYPEGRSALQALIERCLEDQRTLFVFVNNRFEGNAPETLAAILDRVE